MTELRLTQSAVISASDGRPLILRSARLLAGDGVARADCEDAHGQPVLGLRAGPAEPSAATGTWRNQAGRHITGFGVHLTGQGAVLLIDVEPAPDPARARPLLVIDDEPPKERTYRNANPELNDTATATLRRHA
jgi:hypothetical protein